MTDHPPHEVHTSYNIGENRKINDPLEQYNRLYYKVFFPNSKFNPLLCVQFASLASSNRKRNVT